MIIKFTPTVFKTCCVCYRVGSPSLNMKALYIGVCRLDELSKLPDMQTNSEWNKINPDTDELTIEIIAAFNAQQPANIFAETCISIEQPWFNVHGTFGKRAPPGIATRVRCYETRVEYNSASAAAKAVGVSQPTMSAHLNGITRTVRGFKFERIV